MSFEKEVKIYFVRHGETQYNIEKRMQGFCDSPPYRPRHFSGEVCRKGVRRH
ncbi:MAG: histidine phosphatase family protein [Bacillota bacterium]